MPGAPDPLLDEALFYVEWVRGAGARYLPAEVPQPTVAVPPAAHGAMGQGRATQQARGPGQGGGSGPRTGPRGFGPALPATGRRPESGLPGPVVVSPGAVPAGPPDPARWGPLEAEVAGCQRCGLCASRTQAVFGAGSRTPRLVVVGEAPGEEEDAQGVPFVGPAGQLLTRMLSAIGLSRDHDVFILNVLKCRPPANRPPMPQEVAACTPWMKEQLALLGPPPILALGNHATRALLGTERGITSLRGSWMRTPEGWRVMPTFHPAYLLRNPEAKRPVWDDLQAVQVALGMR